MIDMKLWISNQLLRKMLCESKEKDPLESGGILAGYCSKDDSDVIITEIVGPGENAFHGRTTYRPDYEADRDAIGKIFDESGGGISYLGDWHSHPGGAACLSWRDKWALRNIARFSENYRDRPVMLILGGDGFSDLKAWRIERTNLWSPFNRWAYSLMKVRLYEL